MTLTSTVFVVSYEGYRDVNKAMRRYRHISLLTLISPTDYSGPCPQPSSVLTSEGQSAYG
jgi:hypothetical protein